MKDKDKVIFRKDKKTGNVFAIFPYLIAVGAFVTFFDGCHGSGDYRYMIEKSKSATSAEYKYLERVLFNFYGYDTQPIKKYNHKAYLNAYYKSKKQEMKGY